MTHEVVVDISEAQYEKAIAASLFGKILSYSKSKPAAFLLPGTNGKQYQVFFKRDGNKINYECFVDIDGQIGPVCKGVKNICYHAIAALIMSAKESGYELIRNNGNVKNLYSEEKELFLKHRNYASKKYKSFIFKKIENKKTAEECIKEMGF